MTTQAILHSRWLSVDDLPCGPHGFELNHGSGAFGSRALALKVPAVVGDQAPRSALGCLKHVAGGHGHLAGGLGEVGAAAGVEHGAR